MTLRPFLFVALPWFVALAGLAQTAQELNVPVVRYPATELKAQWITHPDLADNEAAVVLFRRSFTLPQKPDRFVVNVSADNHYTLYVNGKQVCFGPQLSDIRHWRYETVDLAPFLTAGRNVLAAEVVNFGPDRFFGMQSYRTAFLLNTPDQPTNSPVNTSARGGWKTFRNGAVRAKQVRWRSLPRDIVGGFYAANPTDSVDVAAYPWGWQNPDFDESTWKGAVFCENASAFGGGFGWLLEPRTVALQIQRVERLSRVAKATGVTVPADFLAGKSPLTVPARTRATLLIDHSVLTMGYPELTFSGGRGGKIRVGYAENLFIPGTANKGNRNQVEGMQFLGVTDVIQPDGSAHRTFRPTWLRTFRFVKLEIQTADEPLTVRDFYNVYTSSPYPVKARFSASDPTYAGVFDLCRRTADLCTQDYFLSDAYYETMQYVGDSKVHDLTWLALTANDHHVRNALEQFHYSRLWDGNLTSCYPLRATFVHPTYSVIWVDMLYDHYLWSGDKEFLKKFASGIRQTLAMFDDLIQSNGLAGKTRWDYFVDWYNEPEARGGLAPGQDGSNSAVVTLHYVYALQNAARIFDALGEPQSAATYRQRADFLKKRVYETCYDATRGLMAERPTKDYFDQHTNILAVLTDALPVAQQKGVLAKILSDPALGQATYYYRFYLFEALHKAGAGELFDQALRPWKALLADGLSTTPERYEAPGKPTRSECHPWSTAPAYHVFGTLAGIRPTEPGFRKLTIAPSFGELTVLEGIYPIPAGEVVFRFGKTAADLTGSVTLPEGVSGTLRWGGASLALKAGSQSVTVPTKAASGGKK
jgi:hypothetical protein